MLDYSPVATVHLILALASFASVFLFLRTSLGPSRTLLRTAPTSQARFGGVALIGAITIFSLFIIDNALLRLGLLSAASLTLIVGTLDEILDLSPLAQLLFQLAIAAVATFAGWTILTVTNPFGSGLIYITFFPGLLTVFWLLLLLNSLNWLDGADGLAPGVATVAFLTLAAVSLLPSTQDKTTLGLALIGAGASLAYLIWNWPPAKVYLGTSGSWFLGLYLGLVAINGGGKIATTLLVLALPVIDSIFVVISRLRAGHRPWQKDRQRHLHHRLLAAGIKPAPLALSIIIFTSLLGYAAVLFQTKYKLLVFTIIGLALLITSVSLWHRQKETSPSR